LYGSGLRLREALGLRVKDADFDRHAVVVRSGKGDKDRVVMLPKALVSRLQTQLVQARALWGLDRASGRSGVFLPHALERKYPRAGGDLGLVLGVPLAQAIGRSANRRGAPSPPAAGGTASPLDALALAH
jgi:integrase